MDTTADLAIRQSLRDRIALLQGWIDRYPEAPEREAWKAEAEQKDARLRRMLRRAYNGAR